MNCYQTILLGAAGNIPPDTRLLISQDGNDKYQIRFEGD